MGKICGCAGYSTVRLPFGLKKPTDAFWLSSAMVLRCDWSLISGVPGSFTSRFVRLMRAPNSHLAEASHPVASLEAAERLLVVFLGYAAPLDREPFADAGRLGNALARGLMVLRSPAVRLHVRFYRDFYANPRSPAYMGEVLDRLLANSADQARTLLVGPRVDIDLGAVGWANEVRLADEDLVRKPRDLSDLTRHHDAALLVHADALGLGLGAFEQTLVAAFPRQVFVLNGRQRLYRLDARMRRRLGRRRVLAETRLVEAALARLVPIAGWLLAARDRLAQKPT